MERARANAKGEGASPKEESVDQLLSAYLSEKPRGRPGEILITELGETETGPRMLALDRNAQADLVGKLLTRSAVLKDAARVSAGDLRADVSIAEIASWASQSSGDRLHQLRLIQIALYTLLCRRLPFSEAVLVRLLDWIYLRPDPSHFGSLMCGLSTDVRNIVAEGSSSEPLREAISRAAERARLYVDVPTCRKVAQEFQSMIGVDEPVVRLDPGEAWSDAARAELVEMEPARRRTWKALLASCQAAGNGKLTAKWMKAVHPLIEAVGRDEFRARLARWFPLVDWPPTVHVTRDSVWEPDWDNYIRPPHVDLLKGLAWSAGLMEDRELARALTALAMSGYRKVREKGDRLPPVGNAAVAALGMMPGKDAIGQLALIKLKARSIPAQKAIEKAITAAAEREGIPREEVEELAVPAYGMEEVGRRREVFGNYVAELVVDGSEAELHWSKADDGTVLKSVPAAVKKERAADVKELQVAVKDIGKMLTAQRDRIDGLFLSRKRWPFDAWRSRYPDHPLVGTIARRLLWQFETNAKTSAGIWHNGQLVGADDQPLKALGPETTVELWHPIDRPESEVMAWRDWLDRHQVRQPFKQAYREIYVLTDAERATRVYSNRFAAHILRQHQYHALCAARGWRDKLRMTFEAFYPATSKELPQWGLRAEFWVEGISHDHGGSTNESGAFLHLSTDQVRFYEINAAPRDARGRADDEPVALDRIPPLIFSEVMRDVDLFVGVASVGADPTWVDGGPDGRYIEYWSQFSFGDLTANGQTRKAVLERLIPRLKIASRCTLSNRFLVVRGDVRTYRIHLGSGNILMEPNDQYLCIVPKQGADLAGAAGVFLPFEGDNTLSIIISKAFLLADDAKIRDSTIVNQIRR